MNFYKYATLISFIIMLLTAESKSDLFYISSGLFLMFGIITIMVRIAIKMDEKEANKKLKHKKIHLKQKTMVVNMDKKQEENNINITVDISKHVTKALEAKTAGLYNKQLFRGLDYDIVPDRTIDIEYIDSKKQASTRTVTAMRIKEEKNKDLYLVGLCHLRKRIRAFRYDRIQSISENGIKRTSAEWLKDIGFDNFRDTREHIAREKLREMVHNMDDAALAEFIKNSN